MSVSESSILEHPPIAQREPSAPREVREFSPAASLLAAITFAIWLSCAVAGVLGYALHYPQPVLPPMIGPTQFKMLHVDLADNAAPTETDSGKNPDPAPTAQVEPDDPPPPAISPAALPSAPPLMAVAAPDPAIAFALPVEGPTQTVEAKKAAPAIAPPAPPTAAPSQPAAAPAVRHLRFGQGEGAQAKPEYPREAKLDNEEGVVVVHFTVDARGKVVSAEVATASEWPMLNNAALRAVRDRWHFPPGEARAYEVSIEFTLETKKK